MTLLALTLLILSTFTTAVQFPERDEWQTNKICFYMTNQPNWEGQSQNMCTIPSFCGNTLPDGLAGNVSSAGPDQGTTCFLFSEENCTGTKSDPIVWPGYANLAEPLIAFNNKARSWRCWKWCGFTSTTSSAHPSAQITHTISVPGVPPKSSPGRPKITKTLSAPVPPKSA